MEPIDQRRLAEQREANAAHRQPFRKKRREAQRRLGERSEPSRVGAKRDTRYAEGRLGEATRRERAQPTNAGGL
jgi:hypothetical protein